MLGSLGYDCDLQSRSFSLARIYAAVAEFARMIRGHNLTLFISLGSLGTLGFFTELARPFGATIQFSVLGFARLGKLREFPYIGKRSVFFSEPIRVE